MSPAETRATSTDSAERAAAGHAPLPIAAVVDTECDPGQELLALRRLSSLAAAGCDVEAFTIDASRAFEARLANERMIVRRLGKQLHADWPSVRDLAAASRHSQRRAIYCMGPRAHARGVVAGSLLHVPATLHPYAIPSFRDLSLARMTGSTLFVSTDASLAQARLAGCDALLVDTPLPLEASERKALQTARCIGWIGAWREANNPWLFERAAEALGRQRHDVSFVMVVLGAFPPRVSSSPRIEIVTVEEFAAGELAKIGVLVHTGFDDACPVAWMEAHLRGMNLVLPADGFVDAFVRRSEACFYTPGYLNELIPAMAAAVDSEQRRAGTQEVRLSPDSGVPLSTALGRVLSRAAR